MPRFNNVRYSSPTPSRFDWLPEKVQGVLLSLVTLTISVILFLLGMHCVHTGKPLDLGLRAPIHAFELFFYSAVVLLISGGLFAVLIGRAKRSTPHVSETHHPRIPK